MLAPRDDKREEARTMPFPMLPMVPAKCRAANIAAVATATATTTTTTATLNATTDNALVCGAVRCSAVKSFLFFFH